MENQLSAIRDKVTPMMQQYLDTKEQYQDCILFYRLGDFYEMFFEDAITVSRELELTLTGKSCGLPERAPMCGVPYHSAEPYINRLIQAGYKVAVCEQTEDPKQAKGIVKREVTRIVTPGTNQDIQSLDEERNNFLMSIYSAIGDMIRPSNTYGIAIADVTTGDFMVTEVTGISALSDEINRNQPSEVVCPQGIDADGSDGIDRVCRRLGITIYKRPDHTFDETAAVRTLSEHFHVKGPESLGVADFPAGTVAAGALLYYLYENHMKELSHFTNLRVYRYGSYMLLDSATQRNLELTKTLMDKKKRGSLLWVLDKTRTAMGGRLLYSYVNQPLRDMDEINKRLDAVEELYLDSCMRDEMREYLDCIYDLERILSKITYATVNPRDMLSLSGSLSMVPHIRTLLEDAKSPLLRELYAGMDELTDVSELIQKAIVDEPPIGIREAGIIREGYNSEADRLRHASTEGKRWLMELEEADRQRTGIKNLKIKYNKVFGYYFEVTNSYKDQVPEDYIRRQTLAGAERYTTPRLKELEDDILNSKDRLENLEYELFCGIRDQVAAATRRIKETAGFLAMLDVYASLALVAEQNGYVRPGINTKGILRIKDGRHPVVECIIGNENFVPNDTVLDTGKKAISVITGPNMAGKSTYMRQCALIVLMAQMGSFVPAAEADIGIADRIFTRVGASDDLAGGSSTFMVEMNEVSNILRNATRDSLLILDEIGRGTSTYDGLSIAWAVVEHIANRKLLGARTLFATHYHELTELEGAMDNVNNYCIAVKESGDDIIFLRKIIKGGADRSYGIQVARLAGLPDMVIERAKQIAAKLSENDIARSGVEISVNTGGSRSQKTTIKRQDEVDSAQMTLSFTSTDEDIIGELRDADIQNMTPLDGLNLLYRLQNKIKNRV